MEQQVYSLTRHLLNCGAFRHLSDGELAKLQWLLLNRNGLLVNGERMMHFWYYADFCAAGVPQFLLHQCNMVLQYAGKRAIELLPELELEA